MGSRVEVGEGEIYLSLHQPSPCLLQTYCRPYGVGDIIIIHAKQLKNPCSRSLLISLFRRAVYLWHRVFLVGRSGLWALLFLTSLFPTDLHFPGRADFLPDSVGSFCKGIHPHALFALWVALWGYLLILFSLLTLQDWPSSSFLCWFCPSYRFVFSHQRSPIFVL